MDNREKIIDYIRKISDLIYVKEERLLEVITQEVKNDKKNRDGE
ncbi:MAG: hypothetical protein ACOCRK_11600 [bacterium]